MCWAYSGVSLHHLAYHVYTPVLDMCDVHLCWTPVASQ